MTTKKVKYSSEIERRDNEETLIGDIEFLNDDRLRLTVLESKDQRFKNELYIYLDSYTWRSNQQWEIIHELPSLNKAQVKNLIDLLQKALKKL